VYYGRMNATLAQNLITNGLADWSFVAGQIIGVVLSMGISYLVYKWGWNKIKNSLNGGIEFYGNENDLIDFDFQDGMEMEAFDRGVENNPNLWPEFEDSIDGYDDMEKEYLEGKKKGYWSNRDEYLNGD